MKQRCSFMALMLLLLSLNKHAFAQKEGIYFTSTDFDTCNLSFTKKDNLRYKFRLNELFHSKYIKIIIGDSTFNLCKDSIFGYRDNEGVSHRIYDKIMYRIINPNESILLYSTTTTVNSKGNQTITNYFFSTNSGSPIYPLTKLNLKKAFPANSNFHELIDIYFKSDKDLVTYDNFYSIYKINRIYNLKWQ